MADPLSQDSAGRRDEDSCVPRPPQSQAGSGEPQCVRAELGCPGGWACHLPTRAECRLCTRLCSTHLTRTHFVFTAGGGRRSCPHPSAEGIEAQRGRTGRLESPTQREAGPRARTPHTDARVTRAFQRRPPQGCGREIKPRLFTLENEGPVCHIIVPKTRDLAPPRCSSPNSRGGTSHSWGLGWRLGVGRWEPGERPGSPPRTG